jgi:hypothetical protein
MIKVTYKWKELSSDGLLKDVSEEGPDYSRDNLNGWGDFDSKEEAFEALEEWDKEYKFSLCGGLVLVEFYEVVNKGE